MTAGKVKLGLYGCGNRTRALLDSLRCEEQYEVVAAYDLRKESAEAAVQKYGGEACESSAQLVAHRGVDAFIISLDPFAHPAAFFETLEARKPIFIEKPIALTAAEAWRMTTAAEERKVPVHVGFMRRYLPEYAAARKFMDDNDPGAIFSVNVRWFHAGETEMINMLANSPDNFRLKVSQIPFHCCHALDIMLLCGGNAKAVSATGVKVVERPYPSPDEVIANITFENGAIGSFHYSSMAYKGEISYLLHAENYTLAFAGSTLDIFRRPELRSLREDGAKDCRPWYMNNIGIQNHQFSGRRVDHKIMGDFLNSVRTGTPMTAPLRDGHRVAELAEAIERSWKEKQTIPLPLNA